MKIIGYLPLGYLGTNQSKFTDEVDATVEAAWDSIVATGSFEDTDGNTINVRGAMFYQNPKVSDGGIVQLENVDGVPPSGADVYGDLNPYSGGISTNIVNIGTTAFYSVDSDTPDTVIDETSEPSEAQVVFSFDDFPVGSNILQLAYGSSVQVAVGNTSGGTRTINWRVFKNDVEIVAAQSMTLPDAKFDVLLIDHSGTSLLAGDVIQVKLWVDDESIVVAGTQNIVLPRSIAVQNADMQLSGSKFLGAEIEGFEEVGAISDVTMTYRVYDAGLGLGLDPASLSARTDAINNVMARPGQIIQAGPADPFSYSWNSPNDIPYFIAYEIADKLRVWRYI